MLEILNHILQLDFEWLFQNYSDAIYVILFLTIFLETGCILMPFLPGDSLLIATGVFAKLGYIKLSYIMLLLFVAAVLGQNANYWFGRKVGLRVLQIKFRGRNIVKEKYLTKTQGFFDKYGTKTIIFARFVPIVRTFAPFVAGIAQMDYKKFLFFDLFGGLIWIGSLVSVGYLLGEASWIFGE
jgi:membrane-associated protein